MVVILLNRGPSSAWVLPQLPATRTAKNSKDQETQLVGLQASKEESKGAGKQLSSSALSHSAHFTTLLEVLLWTRFGHSAMQQWLCHGCVSRGRDSC